MPVLFVKQRISLQLVEFQHHDFLAEGKIVVNTTEDVDLILVAWPSAWEFCTLKLDLLTYILTGKSRLEFDICPNKLAQIKQVDTADEVCPCTAT